jgi:hypothetical protein
MAAIVTDWALEQFLHLPETKPALEFDRGRISQKSSPTTEHYVLRVHLCRAPGHTRPRPGVPELRMILPTTSTVPDVALYGTAELPISPTGSLAAPP